MFQKVPISIKAAALHYLRKIHYSQLKNCQFRQKLYQLRIVRLENTRKANFIVSEKLTYFIIFFKF